VRIDWQAHACQCPFPWLELEESRKFSPQEAVLVSFANRSECIDGRLEEPRGGVRERLREENGLSEPVHEMDFDFNHSAPSLIVANVRPNWNGAPITEKPQCATFSAGELD
jgi:hypothetical protein